MATDSCISQNIRKLREAKHLSEMDMARGTGLPLTFYRVFEETPSKFGAEKLERAAETLGVEVKELVGE